MLPQPMSSSEPREASNPLAHPDLVEALKEQIAAGFPAGLALDLVLNEVVVRAADATRARAAALALRRGEEMVCRAATGEHAPDLGIPLNTSDGLSGACLRTRRSQLCLDTETDPRVDAAASRRLGIRSMLIVPVLEDGDLVGVLEVFGTDPAEFVDSDQNLLEIFARDVARIRRASIQLEQQPALGTVTPIRPAVLPLHEANGARRGPYEVWTLVLGGAGIFLAVAISFVIGLRIGWFQQPERVPAPTGISESAASSPGPGAPNIRPGASATAQVAKPAPDSANGGLVIYQQGKVVFRMQPAVPGKSTGAEPNPNVPPGEAARVWLAADLAESRLRQRQEPQYPAEALAAHRSGDVVLEVLVGTDGSIASTRVLSGDPLLAAAASDAVRTWHYEPYRVQGRPAEFQTDVTLKFSLPE